MLIIVIVKNALVPCFTDVRSCVAGSGIMGFMVFNYHSFLTFSETPIYHSVGKQGCNGRQVGIHSERFTSRNVSFDHFDIRECASRSGGRTG